MLLYKSKVLEFYKASVFDLINEIIKNDKKRKEKENNRKI